MNVDEMPEGRELDALVAERVMGRVPCDKWTHVFHPGPGWLKNCQCQACYPIGDPAYYSTNIAAAWEVIIQVDARFSVDTSLTTGQFWYAKFEDRGDGTWQDEVVVRAAGSTAPLAICRAALKFVDAREALE